ncbi:MAG: 50S ribosomal protein L18Ae [Methanotrichaceae archaeon]|nr:50S ribosomal protein L18Ae [Methanotrichaceae archaeon]
MSIYEVKGKYRAEKVNKAWRSFSKFIESENEKNAVEWVYSLMGSEHGLKRNLIKIDEVSIVE